VAVSDALEIQPPRSRAEPGRQAAGRLGSWWCPLPQAASASRTQSWAVSPRGRATNSRLPAARVLLHLDDIAVDLAVDDVSAVLLEQPQVENAERQRAPLRCPEGTSNRRSRAWVTRTPKTD
jgi:hypothetical protein